MVVCLPHDLLQIYAFFCARYGNITYKDLLEMGYEEFNAKLSSIPNTEPFYEIIKSRVINLSEIKDKEERKYWRKLKETNRIPDIYKSNQEIMNGLQSMVNQSKESFKWNKKT